MAKRLVELCSLLVEDSFGDLAAQIFTILAERGRMHLFGLRNHCAIPLRRLSIGLVTLIQHHIVLHHTDVEEGEPTFYEVDLHAAYLLARSRKLLDIIEQRHGEAAGRLAANILQLGHASVGDLADYYGLGEGSKRDSGIETSAMIEHSKYEQALLNGTSEGDEPISARTFTKGGLKLISEFHDTLRRLLENGFLVKVSNRSFMSPADLEEEINDTIKERHFTDGKTTGPKKEKEFRRHANNLKRKWQEDDTFLGSESHDDANLSSSPTVSNKRIKTKDGPNGVHRAEEDADRRINKLPNEMAVRVNFHKGMIALRTQRLEELAHRTLGPGPAAVYKALLRSLESKIKTGHDGLKLKHDDEDEDDEESMPSSSDLEILEHLDESIEPTDPVKSTKKPKKLPNGTANHRSKSRTVVEDDEDIGPSDIKNEDHSESEDENDNDLETEETDAALTTKQRKKRLDTIDKHLSILAEHPKNFCTRTPGSNNWTIDFTSLSQHFICHELDTMIAARFDPPSIRMLRMLRRHHKLDDRIIAPRAMLRVNDARAKLTALLFAGFAELQELPKDNSRQPSRTSYLWRFDEEAVRSRYLGECYLAMARVLRRLKFEREIVFKAAIEKAERVGVGGDAGEGEEKLTVVDRESLRGWREVQERLVVQLGRLDELVAVLRDFGGKGML